MKKPFLITEIYENLFLGEFLSKKEMNSIVFRLIEKITEEHKTLDKKELLKFYKENYINGINDFYIYEGWYFSGKDIENFMNQLRIQHLSLNIKEKSFYTAINKSIGKRNIHDCYFITLENKLSSPNFEETLRHELSHYLYEKYYWYKIEAISLFFKKFVKIKKIYKDYVKGYNRDMILTELIAYSTDLKEFAVLEDKYIQKLKKTKKTSFKTYKIIILN